MRTVLDVDGVLYKFSHAAQYMLAKKKGLADREDLFWDDSTWDCEQSKEDWDWILGPEQSNYVYRHGHLWSGAVEFVYELQKLTDIILVTKRPHHATKPTLDWVRYTFDHEPFPFDEVHILGPEEQKSQVPADIYIDDSGDNLRELWENTNAHLILMDRPWNQEMYHEKFAHISRKPGGLKMYTRGMTFEAILVEVGEWQKKLSLKRQDGLFTETEERITDTLLTTSPGSGRYGEPSSAQVLSRHG